MEDADGKGQQNILKFEDAINLASINGFEINKSIWPIVKTVLQPFMRKIGD